MRFFRLVRPISVDSAAFVLRTVYIFGLMSREYADIAPGSPKMFATRLRHVPYWQSSPSYNGLYQRIDFRTFPKPFSRKAIWSYRRESIVKFTAARSFSHPRRRIRYYMIKQYSPVGSRVTIYIRLPRRRCSVFTGTRLIQ